MPDVDAPDQTSRPSSAADVTRTIRTVPPLTHAERATLTALAEHSRPADLGEYVVQTSEIAAVVGTEDAAAIAAAVFPLVGRRTERPPERREDEWSAVALVSGVRVHGSLCHIEWGPGMRGHIGDSACSPMDLTRLAEFGLTDPQIDAAVAIAAKQGPERVERNLAYVEAELARGKEIEALGAYTHRAVQGDWAGRAAIAQRKRDAVRRAAAARWEVTRRSIFPPPALRRRTARFSDGQRDSGPARSGALSTAGPSPRRGDAPREEHQGRQAREEESDAAGAPVQNTGPARGYVGRSLLVLALAVSVVGCSAEPREPVPEAADVGSVDGRSATADLLGVWDLAEVPAEFGECHEASIGYRADGRYVTKSGSQIVTGRFSAEPAALPAPSGETSGRQSRRRGFVVVQRPEAHNGLPNCQGFPADIAVSQSPRAAFVEVERGAEGRPDEARVYFDPQASDPAVVLVRRTSGS